MDMNLPELGSPQTRVTCLDVELCTRTSWADAALAYRQIKRGNASGNVRALWLRCCMQTYLYRLGVFIQRHAGKVLFLGILLLSLCCIGLKTASMENDIERLWVEEGGRLSKELEYTKTSLGENSGTSCEMILQTAKPGSEANLLTVDSLLAHYEAVRAATRVTVELFDITWRLRDLCYAANFPNINDDNTIDMILKKLEPCVIISPLDCFWEASQLLGPDFGTYVPMFGYDVKWTNLNPMHMVGTMPDHGVSLPTQKDVETILNRAGISTAYQEKPCLDPYHPECPVSAANFKSKTIPDVGAVLTGGCSGFAAKFMHWEEELIVGGAYRTKSGKLGRAAALQTMIQLMGENDLYEYHRDTYKVSGKDWTPDKAKLIIDTWQRSFTQAINAVVMEKINQTNYHVTAFSTASLVDLMQDFSSVSELRIVVGAVIMLVYVCLSMAKLNDCVESRAGVGVAVVLLLVLSVTAALGVCSVIGLKFNAATTQIVPYIGMGIGVDDMFWITQTFTQVSKSCATSNSRQGAEVGECLKRVGITVLLKSVCSSGAFALAAVIPVPAMRTFCIQCTMLILFNLATMIFVFPAILSIDLKRQRSGRLDFLFCITRRNFEADNVSVRYKQHSEASEISHRSDSSSSCGARLAQQNAVYSTTISKASAGRQVVVRTDLDGSNPVSSVSGDSAYLSPSGHESCSSSSLSSSSSSSRSSLTSSHCSDSEWSAAVPLHSVISSQSYVQSSVNSSCSRSCSLLRIWNCLGSWSLAGFARNTYAPVLIKTPVKVVVLCSFLAVIAASVVGILRVKDGLEIVELVPKSSAQYYFFQQQSKYFGVYNIYAVTEKNFDYTSARGQMLLHTYSNAFLELDSIVKEVDGSPNKSWLHLFRSWLLDIQKAFDKDYSDGYITEEGCRSNCTSEGRLGYKLMVQTGDINDPIDKRRVKKGRLVDDKGIINSQAFYTYLSAWVSNDALAYGASQASLHPMPRKWLHSNADNSLIIPRSQPLQYAQTAYYLHNLSDTDKTVSAIKEIRSICESFSKRGLPNYPQGTVFTFWEQYIKLRFYLTIALLIVLSITFIFLSVALVNPWAAAIIVVTIVVIVVELFGVMGFLELRLSAVPAVTLIIAAGIGLEFTFHLTVAFLTTIGSRNHRVCVALENVLSPVTHGALSTLLSVAMLAQAEFVFIIRYFFVVLTLLVIICVMNGLILLPVLLSIIGPSAEVIPANNSNQLELPPVELQEHRRRRRSSSQRPSERYSPRRRSRRSRRALPIANDPVNNLSTIAEESSQCSTPSVSIEVLPEVVVNTTFPMVTQTMVDERCGCHDDRVAMERPQQRPPPAPRTSRENMSSRRPVPRSTRPSTSPADCSRHLVTTVEATARVKVQVHTPLPSDTSRANVDYKSRRRKPTSSRDSSYLAVIKDTSQDSENT